MTPKRQHTGHVFPYRPRRCPGWEAWLVQWDGEMVACAYPTEAHAQAYLDSLWAKAEKDIGEDCDHCGEPASHQRHGQPVCDECDPEEL